MPNLRKSRAELALSGTLKAHSKRYQYKVAPDCAVIVPLGTAPGYFAKSERAIWAELARSAPIGLLTRCDRLAVEVAVHLVSRMRQTAPKPSEFAVLVSTLARLGLTPSDRLKMRLEPLTKPAEVDPAWAALDELD